MYREIGILAEPTKLPLLINDLTLHAYYTQRAPGELWIFISGR